MTAPLQNLSGLLHLDSLLLSFRRARHPYLVTSKDRQLPRNLHHGGKRFLPALEV